MIHILQRWIVFFLSGIVWIIFSSCHDVHSAPDYSKTPVLFVHGSGLTSRTWTKMMKDLIRMGYPKEYLHALDIIPRDSSNIKAARKFIKPSVQKVLQKATVAARRAGHNIKHQRFDIVSHSMGAVSSRWYTVKLHPELVRTWISIAGANHGTNALCSYKTSGSKEMCPAFAASIEQNQVQIDLNGTIKKPIDETPFGFGNDRKKVKRIPPNKLRNILYFTIRIEPDRWIRPAHSALLDGAGGLKLSVPPDIPVKETSPGNYLFKKNVGHDPLPQDSDLIRFVARLLEVRDGQ